MTFKVEIVVGDFDLNLSPYLEGFSGESCLT